MRFLLLALVAGLAVLAVGIRGEDVIDDVGEADKETEIYLEDDDAMDRMMRALFDAEEFEESRTEREMKQEARARGDGNKEVAEDRAVAEEPAEEEKAVDAKDQARYNTFIDTYFRRLNSFARSRFDPLSVSLSGKPKDGKGNKAKADRGKKKKKPGKSGKGGNKKGKSKKNSKKGGNKNGGKKSGRHPKDLDLDEVAEEHEESIVQEEEPVAPVVHDISKREAEITEFVEIDEEEHEESVIEEEESDVHDISKREAEIDEEEEETDLEEEEEDEEESLVRVTRQAEEERDDSPMEETSRRGKPAKDGKKGAAKKGKKKKKKGGNRKRKGGKKSGNKKKGKKDGNQKSGKKSGKNSGKKSKRSTKSDKSRTSRASVTGIATVRRTGDVKVSNKKGGKEMRASFKIGPVALKVTRKFGSGKDTISKEARAVSPELTGKLSIHVASNGKARLTNFRINRPAIVQVEGSLKKADNKGKTDNNFMERSIGRISPFASKRLKAASREILSAGEAKAKAEN